MLHIEFFLIWDVATADNLPYEKVGKNEPVCIADEVPFEIPESWEWVRLGSVCFIERGGSPRPIKQFLTNSSSGINWIKIGDTDKDGKYINSAKEKIVPAGVAKSRMVYAGDLLLTNSMSFGRPYILNIDGCIHDGWLVLSHYEKCYNIDFLYYMLSSKYAYSQFCNVVSGAVVKNLNSDKVASALFPLPPLTEQQRIVAIIEKIIPYVNEYKLKEEALSSLKAKFPERLKKAILQEAVQGKLVAQDPDDEPASVLLERIRAEKERLIQEGKIKRDKHESIIYRRDNSHYEKRGSETICIDNEIPFEIPQNWIWCRLRSLLIQASTGPFGSMLHKEDYTPSGIPLVNPANITAGYIISTKLKYVSPTTAQRLKSYSLHSGDVIIGRRGEMGRSAVVLPSQSEWLCGTGCFFVTPCSVLNPEYLVFLLSSPYVKSVLMAESVGTTMNNLNHNILGDILIPLPPFNEQIKIMKKYVEAIVPLDV